MTVLDDPALGVNSIDALVAWPVLVPRDYIQMVLERKREALVIFAHYSALVDTHKNKWVFCDGGECLVSSINDIGSICGSLDYYLLDADAQITLKKDIIVIDYKPRQDTEVVNILLQVGTRHDPSENKGLSGSDTTEDIGRDLFDYAYQ
ncbi:hypothetical protein M752DRAFT_267338 [Aspergillus phoenicis ATCC 13157]|uniref:Uncharacterized protein n=1 Tax=Aspergillus phoenicis ATCC 13157 TaxID=1353007 RepID=A0A370PFQ1_ASPPH|nr:hypothetical protein M752DRAFT_267338 [Aspergillus phoenicis ATCC 13157]